ncbi:hypothetical protein OH77DRAFT_1521142 [Trametes cingulata]|nr:hypothetical protein OH77DRAFT_1521142 [Trametes cingulata]
MKFTTVLPAAGLVVTLALGAASQKFSTAIQSINLVATTFSNLDQQIGRVNENNVGNEGRAIAEGLNDIVQVLSKEDQTFTGAEDPEPFRDSDQQLVIDGVDSLVDAARGMLETLMDKQGLAAEYILSEGIIQGIRQLRTASEQYVGYVIALAPKDEDQGNEAYDNLDIYFEAALQTYES